MNPTTPQTPPDAPSHAATVLFNAALDKIQALELKLQEAERQRDEAKKGLRDITDSFDGMSLSWHESQAERDQAVRERDEVKAENLQLIKVVDELEKYKGIAIYCHGGQLALKAYSLLPHVQAKKGKE